MSGIVRPKGLLAAALTLSCLLHGATGGLFAVAADAAPAADAADAVVAYRGPVRQLFETHCVGCHNPDTAEGGLDLSSHRGVLAGGGSGKVVDPGSPSRSRLMKLVRHEERPYMPPDSERLADAGLDLLERWIRDGALDAATDIADEPTASPLDRVSPISVAVSPIAGRSPETLFERLRTERASGAVTAIATNAHVPIVAIPAYGAVRLQDTSTFGQLGRLEFPEGTVHVLRFSRDGSVLLAGGGTQGHFGAVVLWDVSRGRRIARFGSESDVVLAADVTHDHDFVALGGPNRTVSLYDTASGARLHTIDRHSDWVTALAFSPDGTLLACGDRSGAIRLVETLSGLDYAVLDGHAKSVTAVAWRGDSNLLASTGEEGSVRMWDVRSGEEIANWPAHDKGATGVVFTPDNLAVVTCGRESTAKRWSPAGELQQEYPLETAESLTGVTVQHDGARIVAGDVSGDVHVWQTADGKPVASIPSTSESAPIVEYVERRVVVETPGPNWLAIGLANGAFVLCVLAGLWFGLRRRKSVTAASEPLDTAAPTPSERLVA